MLGITFLSFIILWSTIQADYPRDAFETVCVPNQACYYVSKFKTSYETAQQMCQEKSQQNSIPFDEIDNTILNSLANNLLTKRYWVLEPNNQVIQQNPNEVTILLNRKKRSFRGLHHGNFMSRFSQVENWDWPHIISMTRGADQTQLGYNIGHMLRAFRMGHYRHISPMMLSQWRHTFHVLHRTRIYIRIRRIYRRWRKLIAEFGNKNWKVYIKQLHPKLQHLWKTKFKYILRLIKNRQPFKVDPKLLHKFKIFMCKLRRKLYGKQVFHERIIIKWKLYVKRLIKWNWEELMKFVNEKYKERVRNAIEELLVIVQNKNYEKINGELIENVRFAMRLLNRLQKIHFKYGGSEKYELITAIRLIIKLDWENIINKIDGIDRAKWIERFKLIIPLIKSKQYDKIDVELLSEFKEIIDKIKLKADEKSQLGDLKVKRLVNYVRQLKEWNWPEIVKNVDEKDREKLTEDIKYVIKLINEKRFDEIDDAFFNRVQVIFKTIRDRKNIETTEKKSVLDESTIAKIKESVKLLQEWKWDTLLIYIDEKNRQQVEKDVKEIISVSASGNFDNLDAEFVKSFFQIFDIFSQIIDAMKNGYVFDNTTNTWVKNITVNENERKKRSVDSNSDLNSSAKVNIELINESISKLQRALSYNMMLLKNDYQQPYNKYQNDYRSHLCPFIDNVNEKLIRKLTDCQINQRFICKRQLN